MARPNKRERERLKLRDAALDELALLEERERVVTGKAHAHRLMRDGQEVGRAPACRRTRFLAGNKLTIACGVGGFAPSQEDLSSARRADGHPSNTGASPRLPRDCYPLNRR
jgi:hypothetical protein